MLGRLLATAVVVATAAFVAAAPAAASSGAAGSGTAVGSRGQVVLVAVPDLRWVDLEVMPALRAFAAQSAVAELSVKTASGIPRCAAGSLTFSAGNRANASMSVHGCHIDATTLHTLRESALTGKYGAHIGAFGTALHDAGLRTAAVGDAAIPLVADETGAVDVRTDSIAAGLAEADVVARVVETIYHSPAADRIDAARQVDARLARELAGVPPGTTVVIAGTSDGATTRMHLHTLLIRGPGWPHRELRSPSTHAPYVQLRDVAPTILSVLHLAVPDTMVGRPATPTDNAVQSPAAYADDDDHSVTARDIGHRLRNILDETCIAVILLVLLGEWRRSHAATVAMWLARVVVGAPVASYFVQVLPWWRWGSWAYTGLVVAVSLVIAALVTVATRRSAALGVIAAPAVTVAILVADQFAGAPLQLSAPMGDSPISAGRFHGMGNTSFALMCTGMVICAAVLGAALIGRGRRTAGLALAATLLVIAMVVDAAPPLGDDFGGILTMGPVTAVVVALLAGVALTWRRLLLVVAGALALAVGVALLDYARPAEHQTHVGRFVGEVLHGGAARTVRRKLDASLSSFGNVAATVLVVVTAAAIAVDRHRLLAALRRVPGLPAAAVGVGMIAVLGTLLNDSGVVVAAAALLLGVLSPVAAGLHRRSP